MISAWAACRLIINLLLTLHFAFEELHTVFPSSVELYYSFHSSSLRNLEKVVKCRAGRNVRFALFQSEYRLLWVRQFLSFLICRQIIRKLSFFTTCKKFWSFSTFLQRINGCSIPYPSPSSFWVNWASPGTNSYGICTAHLGPVLRQPRSFLCCFHAQH